MKSKLVITGIGTDVGKTVVSAILAEALNASYWKPIQAGDLDYTDSMKVEQWTEHVNIVSEAYRLNQPMSPHAAAEIDAVTIDSSDLLLPQVEGNLIIEGAGGIMVPINSSGLTYLDVFQNWQLPVIVVSRHYLGSINHTLMTVELLKQRNVPIEGVVFVGNENKATEEIILSTTRIKRIARFPIADEVNKSFILEQSKSPQLQYAFL